MIPRRCLIVDAHSSHVSWRVRKYGLNHDIHMFCLPHKSTHLLQPLDVGCLYLLQSTYERYLRIWLQNNPRLAISNVDLLRILQQTRGQVFTMKMMQIACRAAHCWPIDSYIATKPPSAASAISVATSVLAGSIDTPSRLHHLFRQVVDMIRSELTPDKMAIIHQCIDLAAERLTKDRYVACRVVTRQRLRSGRVCK